MKKLIFPIATFMLMLLLVPVLLIAGCQQKSETATFSATVIKADEKSILVRPNEQSSEYKSADLISVNISETSIVDDKGKELMISDITVGAKVDITYGGAIAESYPAQIADCSKLVAHINKSQLPNPMISFDTPDFTSVAGFALEGIPETVKVDGVWLISGELAQLDISTPNGIEGTLRCAKTSDEDISGLYEIKFEQQEDKEYGDMMAKLFYTENEKALARWQRDGYDFVLWFPEIKTDDFMAVASSIIGNVSALESEPVLSAPEQSESSAAAGDSSQLAPAKKIIADSESVTLRIPQEVKFGETATATIINNSSYEIVYGADYTFQYYTNGDWVDLNYQEGKERVWIEIAFSTVPGAEGEFDFVINADEFTVPLEPGKYRLVKNVGVINDNELMQLELASEFAIK